MAAGQYVGKTTQRLEKRIKQHVPATLRQNTDQQMRKKDPDSAIGKHLVQNLSCLNLFDCNMFSIVCQARNTSVLHVLEALYIRKLQPDLCKQMDFVKSLHLFP